jgi:hypothetical protein
LLLSRERGVDRIEEKLVLNLSLHIRAMIDQLPLGPKQLPMGPLLFCGERDSLKQFALQQLGQLAAVSAIRLHLIARFDRDQRGRNYQSFNPIGSQPVCLCVSARRQVIQPEPAGPSLTSHPYLTIYKPVEQISQRWIIPRDPTMKELFPCRDGGHMPTLLMHVNPHRALLSPCQNLPLYIVSHHESLLVEVFLLLLLGL